MSITPGRVRAVPVVPREVGALRVEHVAVLELQELGQAVALRAAARARAPRQQVREAGAARGAGARARGPAPRRRDEVVRRARVRAVVQLVDGHVHARAARDRLTETNFKRCHFDIIYTFFTTNHSQNSRCSAS